MDTQFVRDRITQLRLKKGVSEYQMSYDLGHSRSYVYNISSGETVPPMAGDTSKKKTILILHQANSSMNPKKIPHSCKPPLKNCES